MQQILDAYLLPELTKLVVEYKRFDNLKELQALEKCHKGPVSALVKCGQYICSGGTSTDTKLKVWSCNTKENKQLIQEKHCLECDGCVFSMCAIDDSHVALLPMFLRELQIWNIVNGTKQAYPFRVSAQYFTTVQMFCWNNRLMISDYFESCVWNLSNRKIIREFNKMRLFGFFHDGSILASRYRPEGDTLVIRIDRNLQDEFKLGVAPHGVNEACIVDNDFVAVHCAGYGVSFESGEHDRYPCLSLYRCADWQRMWQCSYDFRNVACLIYNASLGLFFVGDQGSGDLLVIHRQSGLLFRKFDRVHAAQINELVYVNDCLITASSDCSIRVFETI